MTPSPCPLIWWIHIITLKTIDNAQKYSFSCIEAVKHVETMIKGYFNGQNIKKSSFP